MASVNQTDPLPSNSIELDHITDQVDQLLLQLAWSLHKKQTQELRAHNLTVPQFMVLRTLQRRGDPCTMAEVAAEAMQVPATITGIVDRMAAQGLLRRQTNPHDQRSYQVMLTAAGGALLDTVDQERRAMMTPYVAGLTEAARLQLLDALGSLAAAIGGSLPAPLHPSQEKA